jgi:hypothetical protein
MCSFGTTPVPAATHVKRPSRSASKESAAGKETAKILFIQHFGRVVGVCTKSAPIHRYHLMHSNSPAVHRGAQCIFHSTYSA